ncbi:MAG: hypothetical protein ACP5QY_11840, partial [Candidatus Hydrogenedens sp.]
SFSDYTTPVIWGKPLEYGSLKILAIAPNYCFLDFIELEKRLDCSVQLITTEDALHVGCDPLWGIWCREEQKKENIIRQIRDSIEKKWDLIIIAGIVLDILPKEIYESLITKVSKGCGLFIIPAIPLIPSLPHPIEEFINTLEPNTEPSERWKNLFSGGNVRVNDTTNSIKVICAEFKKGRIVYSPNYLSGVMNHALLPEKAVIEEMSYFENAWAGIISLILWSSQISEDCKIVNISDAKPAGPVEEEIPPELPIMAIKNLNQSLLGPGTYPFLIEIKRNDKQKIDEIKVQIRRENELFSYQQYEFKPNIQKKGRIFTQVELPIGAGNYFFDIWLLRKKKVLDFFTKQITFNSWPDIVSVEPNKNFVFPNDSITLKINVSSNIMESREGTIIIQGIDNYPYLKNTEGNLVCEQSQPITGKGGEVRIPLNFADLSGNYLKINIWGAPMRLTSLGVNYSTLFSYRSLYIPIQRKIFKRGWKDIVQLNNIREYNQLQIAKFLMDNFNCGNYLSLDQYKMPGVTKLYQSCIVQMAEETVSKATNKIQREPCINDENYLDKVKNNLNQAVTSTIIPTPFAISLGMNNCLVQTEEWVCFCENCISKFMQFRHFNEYLDTIPELANKFEHENIELLREDIINKNFPAYLSFYKKFMENSFINFEIDIKNKLKTSFSDIPMGFRYYSDKNTIKDIDWIEYINSMDWVVIEPEDFAYSLVSYIKSKGKSFWVCIDFANPQQTPQGLIWNYWNAIFNQANGVWLKNINGDMYSSLPIKLFDKYGSITPEISSLFHISEKIGEGMKNFISQLKPDFNEEVGIYLSTENLFLTNNIPEFSHKNSFTYFTRLLNGYGINPIVITKEDILRSKNMKVLILPCCLWLSEEEIENLSEFLINGTIIADISPGIINNADLTKELQDILSSQDINQEKIGNDNVYLLNKSLSKKIENEPLENVKKEIRFIQDILIRNKVHSPYLNENEWIDGKFYSFNNKRIIVWLPNLTPVIVNNECKINSELFKYNSKLWDVFNDKRIKAGKNISLNIHNLQPLFICSNPYFLKEMKLTAPDVIKSNSHLPVQIELKQKGKEKTFLDHWVNIELKAKGNKKEITINSQIIQTNQEGKGETYISIPKNQPSGRYVI